MGHIAVSELLKKFSPKQLQAYEATRKYRYVLYGGARYGGKSWLLRYWLLLFLLECFHVHGLKGVRVGLFCETYPDLTDRQITKIEAEFPLWLGEIKETKKDGLCFFINSTNGSGKIALRNLDDPSKYQSAEFAAIGVDELTKNTRHVFDYLRGSMRWPGIEHTVFVGTTNPGGIGHAWVKQLWIDRQFPPELASRADEFAFIRSLPSDNPYLTESYWNELNSLTEDLQRAWVRGDWDVFEGQVFTAWSKDQHVIEPFTIPDYWPRWRAIDWGEAKPFCCLWLTRDPDRDRIYIYREIYQAGLSDGEQARAIKAVSEPALWITFADPSMWAKKNIKDMVSSSADEYAGEGVPLTRADNDRLSGKRKVSRLLRPLADGLPGLRVFSTCTNFIRTFPALPYDKLNVEDVDTDAEDHAYDALRYGLTNVKLAEEQKPQEDKPAVDPLRAWRIGVL